MMLRELFSDLPGHWNIFRRPRKLLLNQLGSGIRDGGASATRVLNFVRSGGSNYSFITTRPMVMIQMLERSLRVGGLRMIGGRT